MSPTKERWGQALLQLQFFLRNIFKATCILSFDLQNLEDGKSEVADEEEIQLIEMQSEQQEKKLEQEEIEQEEKEEQKQEEKGMVHCKVCFAEDAIRINECNAHQTEAEDVGVPDAGPAKKEGMQPELQPQVRLEKSIASTKHFV